MEQRGLSSPLPVDPQQGAPQQSQPAAVGNGGSSVNNATTDPSLAVALSASTNSTALSSFPQLPVPQAATLPLSQQNAAAGDTPLAAADDEVIEKEWVEKAKKIVAQTKDDPFAQGQEISKLQADYVKKRYGKEIKLTDE